MLISLHVKNLALIDEAEVNFGKGLNILTGETGAGKSIIMGSIGLALGERADKDMIRTGAEYALVELLFQADSTEQKQILSNMDFPVEEDGTVLIQRKIMQNRNISKVCGETATAKQLKDIASCFIDIHGQHENQVLLHRRKHLEILDEFAEEEIKGILTLLAEACKKYMELKKEWEGTLIDESSRQKEIELITFVVNEIEATRLVPGEDVTLESAYKKMANGKRIMEAVSDAYRYLAGDEGAS
ncbi:MAG: AAA family ATPase, partial [Clostridiales bacterium]|nr:AAA family ATPase [Clostridiales bacterium]